MSGIAIEAYLARLYTDPAAREIFLADPARAAREAGLEEADANSLPPPRERQSLPCAVTQPTTTTPNQINDWRRSSARFIG